MRGFFKRGDVILVIILVAAAGSAWLFIHLARSQSHPTKLHVKTSMEEFRIPLRDTTLTLTGPLGETKLRIDDKHVWIIDAPCPNKLCMKQGKIKRPGESLVCLPNRIVITIEGQSAVDAVTY
ncbi:NusG domain II-containing protein [candidate division WOR-3 bacterium]|nr:NusG domain II-containing protein [candidate division WOR-3 bacterium]